VGRGIIQSAIGNRNAGLELDALEISPSSREVSSELPTVADLVLPGTGQAFSSEFASLLNVLTTGGKSE
jgi:hypothetical protein